jgi:hypothetical protein
LGPRGVTSFAQLPSVLGSVNKEISRSERYGVPTDLLIRKPSSRSRRCESAKGDKAAGRRLGLVAALQAPNFAQLLPKLVADASPSLREERSAGWGWDWMSEPRRWMR